MASIGLEPALMLVLGANLGTAVNPLLEASGAKSGMARRLPLANLANRIFGLVLASLLMPLVIDQAIRLGLSPANSVAGFHLAFNLVLALVALPVLGPLARCWSA